jgi:hypothetical protein
VAVVALAALGACSSDDAPPPVHPPSPFFSSSGPTGATLQTGTTSTGPSGTTAAGGPTGGHTVTGSTGGDGGGDNGGGGKISHGTLSVDVTGGIQVSRTLRELVTASYAPPGGAIAIVWTAGGTDPSTVSIGGLSFVGSHDTATTLTITMTVPSSRTGFDTFVSLGGECRITLTRASSSAVAGSFRCSNLKSASGVTVSATATFSASG